METLVGTPYYIAPEVLKGDYGNGCDIWSLGVLLYILLSGYLPFSGRTQAEVFERITDAKVSFKRKEWEQVSPEAIDLVKEMLTASPASRITAAGALKHRWFKMNRAVEEGKQADHRLDPDIMRSLQEYRGISTLKKAALNVFVKTLATKDVEHLREQFHALDTKQTGFIDVHELSSALRAAHLDLPAPEVERIISEIDYAGNGLINYSEFLAATVSTKEFLTEAKLWALFKQFDTDDTNFITRENI